MRLLTLSDIHLEFHKDDGKEFLASLPTEDIDGVILGGDICSLRMLPDILGWFCDHFGIVLYCWGNHECYGHSIGAVREIANALYTRIPNLYVLDNNRVQVTPEVTFIGGALWFPDGKDNHKWEFFMNDFHKIENFRKEVYHENADAVAFLQKHTQPRDIVLTHYLPSTLSIAEEYEGNDLNRFFLCDMEDAMKEKQPKLWVHGHTHSSFDYTIFRTQVVCNPMGYPHEPNPAFHHLIIDV